MRIEFVNGRILSPQHEFIRDSLVIEDGFISGIGEIGDHIIDLDDCMVLPGIIDLHGDAFEKIILPRENALIPPEIAIKETDRQLVSNGITTAYYSPSITWEIDNYLRTDAGVEYFLDNFFRIKPELFCDSRIHLRYEIYHDDALKKIESWIRENKIDLISFNDHLSYYEERLSDPKQNTKYAGSKGLSIEELKNKFSELKGKRDTALLKMKEMARICSDHNILMASHDDDSIETRKWYREIGCRISEFPCNMETANCARVNNDAVVLGAPNVIRGGSLYCRLDARQCSIDGICDILASDYYYPAQFHAVALLHKYYLLPVEYGWDLISRNPAGTLNLIDRGLIEVGKKADLVVVKEIGNNFHIIATIISGRIVFADKNYFSNYSIMDLTLLS